MMAIVFAGNKIGTLKVAAQVSARTDLCWATVLCELECFLSTMVALCTTSYETHMLTGWIGLLFHLIQFSTFYISIIQSRQTKRVVLGNPTYTRAAPGAMQGQCRYIGTMHMQG